MIPFLGTPRCGLRVFSEKRAGGKCAESASGLCLRSDGGGFRLVASDSFDGYVSFHGTAGLYSGLWRPIDRHGFPAFHGPRDPSPSHGRGEGGRPQLFAKKSTMLVLAVTLHNIPEGMAVGVVFAGMLAENAHITTAAAFALAIGIAIQNFPEGAIISLPLKAENDMSRGKAFLGGMLSGVVEPIAAFLTILLSDLLTPVLPWFLSFAAGAMLYVVVEELIPEASEGEHSNIGTIGFAVGFALMMVLDVALG